MLLLLASMLGAWALGCKASRRHVELQEFYRSLLFQLLSMPFFYKDLLMLDRPL